MKTKTGLMKTKTGLNGPENSDRKASKRADHGPKNSDTYSYQVGGDDAPWEEANDLSAIFDVLGYPKVIEVIDETEKTTIQAFWN